MIIRSVAGNLNLAPQAKELVALVERFCAGDSASLQSAVYELEDADAPKDKLCAAKARLKVFVGQLGRAAKDAGTDLFVKYLDRRACKR